MRVCLDGALAALLQSLRNKYMLKRQESRTHVCGECKRQCRPCNLSETILLILLRCGTLISVIGKLKQLKKKSKQLCDGDTEAECYYTTLYLSVGKSKHKKDGDTYLYHLPEHLCTRIKAYALNADEISRYDGAEGYGDE